MKQINWKVRIQNKTTLTVSYTHLGFVEFDRTTEPKTATVEFYVGGASDESAQENISNLLLACKKCVLKRELHRFEYPALLTGKNIQESGVTPVSYTHLVVELDSENKAKKAGFADVIAMA